MNGYIETERILPMRETVDVLVVGGGPAGFSAAVSAAREGAKTMLVEQSGQVGGVATIGMMSHWTGDTVGGFYAEILERSNGFTLNSNESYEEKQKLIDPERLKITMLDMLEEAGVILQLYTFASDAIMDEDTIKGIIIESKSGREVIMANIVIDASGDGDIAAKTGAEFYKGREYDGKMQPMTIMFKMGGVNTERVTFVGGFEQSYVLPNGEDLQTFSRTKIPYPAGHVLIYPSNLPGVVTLNMTNCIKVDGTKAEDLTRAEKTCRSQILSIVDFLKTEIEGFSDAYLLSSASHIGVRETRHFIGESTLNERDIMAARIFEDWVVANVHFNFDVHNLEGAGLDTTGVQMHFPQNRRYTIPYGCFIPKKIEGLMLAGRNISGTHMAHSSYRVMPICANMGQSVGVAAAMASRLGVTPRTLEVKTLQERLMELGVKPQSRCEL
jgi:hypothetical protein